MKRRRYSFVLVSIWIICLVTMLCGFKADKKNTVDNRQPVIFFSGGSIDDFVTYMLLLTMDHVDLKGVVLTNADTLPSLAMDAHWKVATLCQSADIPISLSKARGWNPFPYEYRHDVIPFLKIESLKQFDKNKHWPPYPSGEASIKKLLKEAVHIGRPVTLLVTCPITALKNVLSENPDLEAGVKRLIFMGGAVRVDGNLDPKTISPEMANSKAEWNIFWDPESTAWIFDHTSFEIVLLPLDVTNHAKLTTDFRDGLKAQGQNYLWSRVASEGYDLTLDEPFYCLWNSTATCYLGQPELFKKPQTVQLKVITQGFLQGTLKESKQGRDVRVVFDFADLQGFYDYFHRQLKR